MDNRRLPEPEVIRQLLSYDRDTGKLTWNTRDSSVFTAGRFTAQAQANMWNGKYAGKEAFTAITSKGYRYSAILNVRVMGHRVVYAHYHGAWPDDEIDHINGVRSDNRIANLRVVNRAQNNRNTHSTKGYSFCADGRLRPWRAYIQYEGVMIHLGSYATENEAHQARALGEHRYGYGRWS